ncbi:MAG: TlpA disulfide reductase family protein [Anaerolineaceae bacterium]|nr:TlpA disulfide reductase family protein [Anaerolineaceae bacterium]
MLHKKGLILLLGGLLFGVVMSGIVYLTGVTNTAGVNKDAFTVLKAGNPMPDFDLTSLDNSDIHISQYLGKPVIVNFWASWCVPCKQEMPLLERYYQAQNGQLIIVGINNQESVDIARPFVLENHISFPILMDLQGKIRDQFMIRGFPTSLFINSKGVYIAEHIGTLDEESLKSYLQLIGVKI